MKTLLDPNRLNFSKMPEEDDDAVRSVRAIMRGKLIENTIGPTLERTKHDPKDRDDRGDDDDREEPQEE